MMRWLSRIEIALGVWLISSPWLLGYGGLVPARWNSVIPGVLIALIGFWTWLGTDEAHPK